jgi:hypothetical protein
MELGGAKLKVGIDARQIGLVIKDTILYIVA